MNPRGIPAHRARATTIPWAVLVLSLLSLALAARPAAAEPVTFGSGAGDWGFRESWRCYIVSPIAAGDIEPSEGASQIPGTTGSGGLCGAGGAGSEALRFPISGGTYDEATGELALDLSGKVRFWGHQMPGGPALDSTFYDLRVTASGDAGVLTADADAKQMSDGQMAHYEDVPLVDLDLSAVEPAPTAAGLAWQQIPATLTEEGAPVFGGSYSPGDEFDPVTLDAAFGTPQVEPDPDPEPQPGPTGPTGPTGPSGPIGPARDPLPAAVSGAKRLVKLGRGRVARVGTVACPAIDEPCRVRVRRTVAVKIAGKSYRLRVIAPKRVAPASGAAIRVRLPKAAHAALEGRRARVALKVATRAGTTEETTRLVVRIGR